MKASLKKAPGHLILEPKRLNINTKLSKIQARTYQKQLDAKSSYVTAKLIVELDRYQMETNSEVIRS